MRKNKVLKVKPKLKSFNCKSCGSIVQITVIGQTLNVVCSSCRAIIDANDPEFNILQEGVKKQKYNPCIPLNSRGKLKGILWEVIGFVVKLDTIYSWREYLLFNPYNGYRWLVEVDGHFALYKRIHYRPRRGLLDSLSYKAKKFKIFNRGSAIVDYVEGEFFWRIKRGDKSEVADYIFPPYGLSFEKSKNEVNWTYGHHIDAETIEKVFKVKTMPDQYGVGQLQPSPFKEKFKAMFKTLSIAISIVTALQILRAITAENKIIFSHAVDYKEGESLSLFKTPEFKIEGGKSNVKLLGDSNIYNSWVFVDALLVNATSQRGIPIPLDISYYRGPDWSEGKRKKSRIIYNVPDGNYYLSVKTRSGGMRSNSLKRLVLIVYRDIPIFSNVMIVYILICLGPLFILFKKRHFEVSRWSKSDYSPYQED